LFSKDDRCDNQQIGKTTCVTLITALPKCNLRSILQNLSHGLVEIFKLRILRTFKILPNVWQDPEASKLFEDLYNILFI